MASRFFYDPYEYDPFGYYTAAPYDYNLCYRRQPAATRRSTRGIFAGAEPAAAKPAPRARETKMSFSIPVHDSDPDPEMKQKAPGARAKPVAAPAMSAEEAVVRMQATARGFLARKAVRAVRQVHREAEQVAVSSKVEALVADPRARAAVGEALMRMLLRLDAVRGAREYRRSVTKLVLALQDAVDSLAPAAAPVSSGGDEADADAPEATDVEIEEESVAAQELRPDAAERDNEDNEMESIKTMVDTPTQVEVQVDEAVAAAASEPEAEQGEEEKKDANVDVDAQVEETKDANVDVDEPEDSDAEVEWEMVTEEENEHIVPVAAITAMSDDQEPSCNEPTYPLQTMTAASTGADSDGVDVRKLMEMVVALREQTAQQCAVIGALAERVDALELTVRQMEDAESHRQQAKKPSAEHKEHMNQ